MCMFNLRNEIYKHALIIDSFADFNSPLMGNINSLYPIHLTLCSDISTNIIDHTSFLYALRRRKY